MIRSVPLLAALTLAAPAAASAPPNDAPKRKEVAAVTKREVLKLNGGWPVSVRRVSRVKIDHLYTGARYRTGYALSYEWCGPKSQVKCVRPFQADVGTNGLLDGQHSIRSYKRHPCRPEDGC
jgi:hypothetical protein